MNIVELKFPSLNRCGECMEVKICKYGVKTLYGLAVGSMNWINKLRERKEIDAEGDQVGVIGYMCEDCAVLDKL